MSKNINIPMPERAAVTARLYTMASIPNHVGYRFNLVTPNGMIVPVVVAKDANGCHYVADLKGTHRGLDAFAGWMPL